DVVAHGWAAGEVQQAGRVLLHDQRPYLGLDVQVLEILDPPVGRDGREVRAEEHLVAQQAVGVPHEQGREVLRRPAGQVDVDARLVRRDRQGLLLPREGRVGEDDVQVREISGHVVDVQRVGVLQAEPAAARRAGPGSGLAGVEQGHEAVLGDDLVERVGDPVVRIEALRAGMKLEPPDPVVGGQAPGEAHPGRAAGRIDAPERDDHIGVLGGELRELDVVRHRLVAGPGDGVDGERDAGHGALTVVVGQVGDGVVRHRPDAEILAHGLLAAGGLVLIGAHRPVDVGVHVDRGDGGDVHWHGCVVPPWGCPVLLRDYAEKSSTYGAAVRSLTASGRTPGAHSFSRSCPPARWKTARSVYTRVTTRRPVSGNVHSSTIFGRPARSTCSITTHTSRAPATRSIAPPTAGFLPGTYQFARSPCAETCSAPTPLTARWPPRTTANDIAESTMAAPLISVAGCLPASVRSGSARPGGAGGPRPRTPFSACRMTSVPSGMNRGISSG